MIILRKMRIAIILLIITLITLSGCQTKDAHYPNITFNQFEKNDMLVNFYLLPGQNSKTLYIFLDGTSKQSVLGIQKNGSWTTLGIPYFLRKLLPLDADLLVPEKINLEPGEEVSTNRLAIKEDTLKNKLLLYTPILDRYITRNSNYAHIYLLGYSEGGFLIPKLYTQLKNKQHISGIILCGSGGLSDYETLKIQQASTQNFTPEYKANLKELDRAVRKIKLRPTLTDHYYFGWTYAKWADYLSYRPIQDLVKISIPILVIHGDQDLNIPVESSRYIQRAFQKNKKTNLTYIELPNSNHIFNAQFDTIIDEIQHWTDEINKE